MSGSGYNIPSDLRLTAQVLDADRRAASLMCAEVAATAEELRMLLVMLGLMEEKQ